MGKGTTPGQPASPPKGTSPSKVIQNGANTSWDGWHQHGNKDPKAAIASDKSSVRKEIKPASMKK